MASEDVSMLIVSRAARARRGDALSRWLDDVGRAAAQTAGFAGALRLGQAEGLQHLVLRFDGRENADAFAGSTAFADLLERAGAVSVGHHVVESGARVSVELPSDSSSNPTRRFMLTWLTVYPPLLAVVYAIKALAPSLSTAVQLLISSLVLVGALQFVVLPFLQRLARAWLLAGENGGLKT